MTSTLPLYQKIKEDIKRLIDGGELGAGAKVPSVNAITMQYGVSSITAVRVLKELDKENYARHEPGKGYFVPSRQERKQRTKLRGVLGCIMRPYRPVTPHDNYFNEINTGIQRKAMQLEYDALYPSAAFTLASKVLTPQAYASLKRGILRLADAVDGFILDERVPDEMVKELLEDLPHPLVMVRRTCSVGRVESVAASYGPGVARAMELALRAGYQRFILCTGNREMPWEEDSMRAVGRTLAEHGVPKERITDSVDGYTSPWEKTIAELMPPLEAFRKAGKTLVVACNDATARSICTSLIPLGLTAGKDYGLIGFGGMGYTRMASPQIATVDTKPIAIGELAVENLLHSLGKDVDFHGERDAGFDIIMGDTF